MSWRRVDGKSASWRQVVGPVFVNKYVTQWPTDDLWLCWFFCHYIILYYRLILPPWWLNSQLKAKVLGKYTSEFGISFTYFYKENSMTRNGINSKWELTKKNFFIISSQLFYLIWFEQDHFLFISSVWYSAGLELKIFSETQTWHLMMLNKIKNKRKTSTNK